ncbi:hypothetical protein J4440_02585 [Candidatus Woesearchaeota archaeon]|nr:hypothetical protein [Candidatus Woesearchaeota archaeon]
MKNNENESSIQAVLEDVTFILNEIKHKKFDSLRKTKITVQQEKIIEGVERDLDVCVTKIGLLLHAKEL